MTETSQGGPVRFHQQGPRDIPWQNGPDKPCKSGTSRALPASAGIGGSHEDRPNRTMRGKSAPPQTGQVSNGSRTGGGGWYDPIAQE
jgi:hypothetical protein